MARQPKPRVWANLAESTRKRYLASGRKQNLTAQQVQQHYESGGNMAVFRGHPSHHGLSERQWAKLRRAANAARLGGDHPDDWPGTNSAFVTHVLDSLLAKGFTYNQILDWLIEKRESRATYRSTLARAQRSQGIDAGSQPGRNRYYARNTYADIEVFYYH